MTPSSQQSFFLSYRENSICLFTNMENFNIKKYWTSFQNSSFKHSWFILHQVSATLFYEHQRAMQTGSWTAFSLKTAFSFGAHKICLSFDGIEQPLCGHWWEDSLETEQPWLLHVRTRLTASLPGALSPGHWLSLSHGILFFLCQGPWRDTK